MEDNSNNEIMENSTAILNWDINVEKIEQVEKEALWKERTGLTEETLRGAIEAIIYMSDKPINIQKIKKAIDPDIPLRLIQEEIEQLQETFEQSMHGLRLVEVAEGYQFRTKVQYSKVLNEIYKAPVISLSPLALEVLAVIAFKQPISKMEIDQMRGVDSGHLIRGLIDKGLLKVVGRSDEAGKPVTYGTTNDFLELFELDQLDSLPTMNELSEIAEQNTVGDIEDIRELVKVDKEKFMYDELEEIDRIREQINKVKTDTDFTKELKVNKKKEKKDEESKTAFDVLEEYVEEAKSEVIDPLEEEMNLNLSKNEAETESENQEESESNQLFEDAEELEKLLDDAFTDISESTKMFADDENLHESEISRIQETLKQVEESRLEEAEDSDLEDR